MIAPFLKLFLLICVAPLSLLMAQDWDVHPPVKVPLHLSGTFGELRNGHFHAGIDIKTQGKKGLRIYAIDDGIVSRIKISSSGYGSALYIDHENGYTSVYAHLDEYNEAIHAFIENVQYEKESFAIDTLITSTNIAVKKGEIIAFSGNSGSSLAPHLHFEIRNTKTEVPLNPLHFNFEVEDNKEPLIESLLVYGNYNEEQYIEINGKEIGITKVDQGNYTLTTDTLLLNADNCTFAIQCFDQQTHTVNKNGIYKINYWFDESLTFSFSMDSISFNETDEINAHTAYFQRVFEKTSYHKCFRERNNDLSIYHSRKRGLIPLNDGLPHRVKIEVFDIAGNTSVLHFLVKKSTKGLKFKAFDQTPETFYHSLPNYLDNGFIQIDIPANALYGDIKFNYSNDTSRDSLVCSHNHYVGNVGIPLKNDIEICIRPTDRVDKNELKVGVVAKNIKDEGVSLLDNQRKKYPYHCGTSDGFGVFQLYMDTIAPTIELVKPKEISTENKNQRIVFRIDDNVSNRLEFSVKVNDIWSLFQYDLKNKTISGYLKNLKEGHNDIRIEVKDDLNNIRIINLKITL